MGHGRNKEIDKFLIKDGIDRISKEENEKPGTKNPPSPVGVVNGKSVSFPKSKKQAFPEVGHQLRKCILTAQIGKGSSCHVFEAFHEALKIPVAIKVFLPNEFIQIESVRECFGIEAQTLAQLSHPYIVSILSIIFVYFLARV